MIDLVCTIDENYVPHCAAMLASVMENTKSQLNVYIIHDGINSKKLKKLTGFVEERGHTATGLMCDIDMLMGAPVTDHISLATYFRLLIPKLLPQSCRKVLFLDSDIVVPGNIDELYRTDVSQHPLAAVHHGFPDKMTQANLGFLPNESYFNAGVMLINLSHWRDIDFTSQALSFVAENPDKIQFWDQDVLNFFFKNKWLRIDPTWNSMRYFFDLTPGQLQEMGYSRIEIESITKENKIIHFTGAEKPWVRGSKHLHRKIYLTYLKKTPFRPTNPIERSLMYISNEILR